MEKFHRMSEAAKILGVTVKTHQRCDKSGKVHFIRPNGKRRIAESELLRLAGVPEHHITTRN